jgi:hypothetical protein
MECMERLPLLQAVQVYWLNLIAIFLAPLLTVTMASFFTPLAPIVFLSLGIFATVVPYRLGKAPVSYLITCQLVFVLGGFFVPLIFWRCGL